MYKLCIMTLSMNTSQHKLRICSFNSKGHGSDKISYMQKLMKECDILMVQEHWYFEKDLKVFQNLIGNVHMHGISGMNEDDLLIGRPFGGCAILINNHLKCTFSPFQISNRCCGGILKSQKMSILLFNVYMPCDTQYDVANYDRNGHIDV